MAKYTIELRKICEIYGREEVESWFKDYQLSDYLLPDQIDTLNKVTIWSPDRLASRIVDHFYMREIGFETPALFKHFAKNTMHEVMQEYLPLIYTTALIYDPLVNEDYTEEFTRNATGSNTTKDTSTAINNSTSNINTNGSDNSLSLNNDTPQTNVSKPDLLNGTYTSSSNYNEGTSNSTSHNTQDINTTSNSSAEGTSQNQETYTRHVKGNHGISATYQAMIKQFRDNIVAIDKDIINELNSLFFGLY